MQRTVLSPVCWATSAASLDAIIVNLNGVEQCRQLIVGEPDVQNRADDLHYLANVFFSSYAQSPVFRVLPHLPTISVISWVMLA